MKRGPLGSKLEATGLRAYLWVPGLIYLFWVIFIDRDLFPSKRKREDGLDKEAEQMLNPTVLLLQGSEFTESYLLAHTTLTLVLRSFVLTILTVREAGED